MILVTGGAGFSSGITRAMRALAFAEAGMGVGI